MFNFYIVIFTKLCNAIKPCLNTFKKLYQSQNLSKVNLKDYITELADLLLRSYRISSEKIKLILKLEKVEVLKGVSDMGYTAITFVKQIPVNAKIVVKGAFFVNAKLSNAGEEED